MHILRHISNNQLTLFLNR
ncbi:hypothetical protein F383_34805 [Gossypium arboreum]|uniref:Uncharacterized protein n=1 Tax=Gossypium arboreum TaxID=29729 RepID=A0A0B0N5S3_GOSAR|nr:hypothetical protein F383_34805 [Gossypium arboreum]